MASNNVNKCTTQKSPKMLKDFLQEINNHPSTLPRSRSRSRATVEAAVTSFQKLINAVKSLNRSTTSSPPFTLPRSLSRTLLDKFSVKKKKRSSNLNEGITNKVKVKDILRWRSFHGEPSKPLDSLQCINDYISNDISDTVFWEDISVSFTANTITTTTIRSNSSLGLELTSGESDCCSTMDELPCWWGNFFEDQNNDVVATVCEVGPKEDNNNSTGMEDEKEQHSPISVLDSPFREEISDQEFESSFDKSLASMERTKQSLLQSIQWLESLAGVYEQDDDTKLEQEVEQEGQTKNNNAIKTKTKGNLSRAICKLIKEGQDFENKEVCIKDMEKQEQWSKFEEEKHELGLELEFKVLNDLVNEILVDFTNNKLISVI